MALKVTTEISSDVFILHCEGRIVFGDEGAVLRERVRQLLTGTPKIVVNLDAVDHIDSGNWHPRRALCLGEKPWRGTQARLV